MNGNKIFIGRKMMPGCFKSKTKEWVYNLGEKLLLDFNKKHHTMIIAKSGSGKSYLAGILAEELIEKLENYCVIIIDPMGIFSTLSEKNDGPELEKWNEHFASPEVIAQGMKNYEVWIPKGDENKFDKDMYDHSFSIQAFELTHDILCDAFEMDLLDPQVNLYRKAKKLSQKENPNYELSDLIEYTRMHGQDDLCFRSQTVDALISKLSALEELGIISNEGINICSMIKKGRVIVFDLSLSSNHTAKVIINFFAERLLSLRKLCKKKVNRGKKISINEYVPPTNMLIDEAHNFLPGSHILKKYIKEGRNVGCMLSAISQSFDLTKDVYANITNLFVGQLIFNDDIEKIRSMLPIEVKPQIYRALVKSLDVGVFLYYDINKQDEQKIMVRPRKTLHPAPTELVNEEKFIVDADPEIVNKVNDINQELVKYTKKE